MAITTCVLDRSEVGSVRDDWLRLVHDSRAVDTILPEWLAYEALVEGTEEVSVIVARDGDRVCGLLPFARRRMPLRYEIGYRNLATVPLTSTDALCPTLFAEDDASGRALVEALVAAGAGRSVINFDKVPLDSPMWRTVHELSPISQQMWLYRSEAEGRRVIELGASLDDYLQRKFSAKTRRKLRTKQRKVDRACDGNLTLHCLETPDDLPRCLEWLEAVRRKSWQSQILEGDGLDAPDRLRFLAQQGWLRCYFLHSGTEPISYALGRQHDGVFHYEQVGYHLEWTKHRVGTVLLVMLLEDLYQRPDTPRLFDFGPGDADYKQEFATSGTEEAYLWAIRRTPLNAAAYGSFRLLELGLRTAKQTLDRLGVRARFQQLRRALRAKTARSGGLGQGRRPAAEAGVKGDDPQRRPAGDGQ